MPPLTIMSLLASSLRPFGSVVSLETTTLLVIVSSLPLVSTRMSNEIDSPAGSVHH